MTFLLDKIARYNISHSSATGPGTASAVMVLECKHRALTQNTQLFPLFSPNKGKPNVHETKFKGSY